ncbi:MAG: flagellar biosynthesis protein FlhF [Desulfovibrio sp.]|nr:flagellar biosynthesis protein FlhF [Desulfovibrio sp.]
MQVKTFTGSSSQETLAMVKAEMGPDAVILGNRTYRKNGVVCHEITAGLEREGPAIPAPSQGLGSNADAPAAPGGWNEWHREWMRIKDQLFALMKPAIQLDKLTPRQRMALEYLQREGVSDAVAVELYRRLLADPGASVLECLSGIVPVKPFGLEKWPQRIQFLTGPFGSGKTTVGLRFALYLRKIEPAYRIAFINGDCLRGNGRLVLRHWAELSNFAYLEAPDKEAMKRSVEATKDFQIIFIDTPGFSRDQNLARWLSDMDLTGLSAAYHITLAPFDETLQIQEFLKRYRFKDPASVVWTKLDEAVSYGNIVNVANDSGLPVSALSYGPELKESLRPATEPLVWRLIFKRQLPGAEQEPQPPRAPSKTGAKRIGGTVV